MQPKRTRLSMPPQNYDSRDDPRHREYPPHPPNGYYYGPPSHPTSHGHHPMPPPPVPYDPYRAPPSSYNYPGPSQPHYPPPHSQHQPRPITHPMPPSHGPPLTSIEWTTSTARCRASTQFMVRTRTEGSKTHIRSSTYVFWSTAPA
jgi:hypothetical protein